ncbi:DUF5916 domain-containing protein, partial [Candidatus Latescibacterota bacterium]
VLWTAWGRDDGLLQLTKTGQLRGIKNIDRGTLLELKPFALAGLERRIGGNTDDDFKTGIDVKYPITSNLTVDFTSFTDFAQVEADQTMINLTRFDLRYPEKREFFLEGAELFGFSTPHTTPFYTRNIGITPDRDQVPIIAGAKITGKVGRYNIGILNMQTEEEKGYPSTNYAVMRVNRDILENSSFGFIATNMYDTDKHSDRVLGVDFAYRTDKFLDNKNLEISGDFSQNFKEDVNSGVRSGRFGIRYPNDLIEAMLFYNFVGENYDPEMGFVERLDIRGYTVRFGYNPRPDIPHVKQLHFQAVDMHYITDMNGKLQTRDVKFSPFGITTTSEDIFSINVKNTYEYLDEEFNIYSDVMIPIGEYEWWSFDISLKTNPGRPLSFDTFFERGDYFNGEKTSIENGLTYNLNQHFSLTTDMINNYLTIDSRKFNTREYGLRLNTNITTQLYARTYVQWNNEDKLTNLNFRIHFIPQIGSDVFFVYNHIWDGYQDYKTTFNTAIMKIGYRIAF